jgi:hypothetical protein
MVTARAANQIVRGAGASIAVSGARGSVKYAVEAIGHVANSRADQPNPTIHEESSL